MEPVKKWVILISLFCVSSSNAQIMENYVQLSTGYNRIGFFNEVGYKAGINNHQLKLGVRHYTLDNFFEKNTLGLSLDYSFNSVTSNKKYFFYPGISTAFFVEHKTTARVFIADYKFINGIGANLNSKWSLFYQLGVGVITTKSFVNSTSDVTETAYFNYELAIGVSYKIPRKTIKTVRE